MRSNEVEWLFLNIYKDVIVAQWRHMATETWVNIGSGNALLPDGTKPLPELMLTWDPHMHHSAS